jgi:hypothetical protein
MGVKSFKNFSQIWVFIILGLLVAAAAASFSDRSGIRPEIRVFALTFA